jgi:hypothetical protein
MPERLTGEELREIRERCGPLPGHPWIVNDMSDVRDNEGRTLSFGGFAGATARLVEFRNYAIRLLAALAAETTARQQAEAHAVALQRIIDEHREGMARAMPPRAR